MNRKNINDQVSTNKWILQKQKVFQIDNADLNKILASKKEPHGTKNALKYLIRYNDNDVIRPLCLRFPQITGYAKNLMKMQHENSMKMSFRVNSNKQILKMYNKIWEKIEKLMSINFESKPVYGDDDKYIKIKI